MCIKGWWGKKFDIFCVWLILMVVEYGIFVEKIIFFIELLDICFLFISFIILNRVKFNKFKWYILVINLWV